VNDSELMPTTMCAERSDGLFYSKSDEKFTVRALLEDLFGNRTFERGLDIGCGPGHITEPLASRTKQLTLVEKVPELQDLLRNKFANARVVISDFNEMQLASKFDAILFAHVLYYQPVERWHGIVNSLLNLLSDEGDLYLILNADSGDWWKIMQSFAPALSQHFSFHYIPLSKFKRDLADIATVKSFPYRFQVWIDPGAWSDFIGKQILEISDEAVLREQAPQFAQFAKQFKQVDGQLVMDFRAEVLKLHKI
jgi:SAM-dependent methyltransferase